VDPLPLAHARLGRELTPLERQRHGIDAEAPLAPAPPPPPADPLAPHVRPAPADGAALAEAAVLCLEAGDRDSYRRLCAAVGDCLPRDTVDNTSWATWTSVLGPGGLDDYVPVLRAAEKAFGPKPNVYQLNTLGLIVYRAGRFEDAVKRMEETVALRDKADPDHDLFIACDSCILAMAHARLGHADEARNLLGKAVANLGRVKGGPFRKEIELLRREAEEVVGK
jgi:hypothetical protein